MDKFNRLNEIILEKYIYLKLSEEHEKYHINVLKNSHPVMKLLISLGDLFQILMKHPFPGLEWSEH